MSSPSHHSEDRGAYIDDNNNGMTTVEHISDEQHNQQKEMVDDSLLDVEQEEENASAFDHYHNQQKSLFHSLKEVALAFFPIGLMSYGGQQANLALLQQNFVENRKWISMDHFLGLFSICQAIPGPSVTQIVNVIGISRAGYLGGLLAVILYCLPGYLVLISLGSVIYYEVFGSNTGPGGLPYWFKWIQHGLSCSAVAIIAKAAIDLSPKADKLFKKALVVVAASIMILYKPPWMLPCLLLLGGVYSVVHIRLGKYVTQRLNLTNRVSRRGDFTWKERLSVLWRLVKSFWDREPDQQPEEELQASAGDPQSVNDTQTELDVELEQQQQPQENNNTGNTGSIHTRLPLKPVSGIIFFSLFVTVLISALIIRQFVSWKFFIMFEGFFRMGTFFIGGPHVVLPMIMVEFTERNKFMTKEQFMNGYAISSAIMGPKMNLIAYFGAVMGGVPGGILAHTSLMAPGYMLILAVLPFWNLIREKPLIKQMLQGANSVSIGLVYAALYMIWMSVVEELTLPLSVSLSLVTVIIDFALLHLAKASTFLVIVLSGFFRLVLFWIANA